MYFHGFHKLGLWRVLPKDTLMKIPSGSRGPTGYKSSTLTLNHSEPLHKINFCLISLLLASLRNKVFNKTRGPRWPWIAHLSFLDYPSRFFFFVPFREELTRISLCLYSASSPYSLIPCLLTDQNFANTFWKGSLKEHILWNYFKIWPVVSEKTVF